MVTSYMNSQLKDILIVLDAAVEDLEKWSVYNEDQYNEEIHDIKELIKKVESVYINGSDEAH